MYISDYDKTVSNPIKGRAYVITDKVHMDKFDSISKESIREQLRFSKSKVYVLYVGGFNKLKGALTILKAINECNSDINLIFLNSIDLKDYRNNKTVSFRKRIKSLVPFTYESKCIDIYCKLIKRVI